MDSKDYRQINTSSGSLGVFFRWCLAVAFLLPFSVVKAADGGTSSAFELSVGGGWSDIAYRPLAPEVSNAGSWGLTAHAGYTLFFTPVVGVSLGVDLSRYGVALTPPSALSWAGQTDSDGEPYEHRLMLSGWRERHNALYAQFPVSLRFDVPVGQIRFLAEVGVKYGIYLSGGTVASGSVTHTGWYDKWHLLLYDLPPYGFYTETDFNPRTEVKYRDMWSAFLKVGVAMPLTAHMSLTCRFFFEGGFTDIMPAGRTVSELGFRNDRPGMESLHAFMPDYTSLLDTDLVGNRANALSLGLELGLSWRIPHRKRYTCRCLFD